MWFCPDLVDHFKRSGRPIFEVSRAEITKITMTSFSIVEHLFTLFALILGVHQFGAKPLPVALHFLKLPFHRREIPRPVHWETFSPPMWA